MASYYVASTGNDAGAGTLGDPWKTIKKGMEFLSAGDTLFIRGGTYTPTVDISSLTTGTSVNPITVQNYQNEVVILNAPTGRIRFDGGVDYWTIDGLTFQNSTFGAIGAHIRVGQSTGVSNRAENITIQNCKFLTTGVNCIVPQNSNNLTVQNCLFDTINTGINGTGVLGIYGGDYMQNTIVDECVFVDCHADGIQIGDQGASTVFTCDITNCTFWMRSPEWTSWGEEGIDLKTVDGPVTISNCKFKGFFISEPNGEGYSGGGGGGIEIHNGANNVTIENCYFDYCTSGVVVSDRQAAGFRQTADITISGCIFTRIRDQAATSLRSAYDGRALKISDESSGLVIDGCIFYDIDSDFIQWIDETAGTWTNNIVAGGVLTELGTGTPNWTYNNTQWYTSYVTPDTELNDIATDTETAGDFESGLSLGETYGKTIEASGKTDIYILSTRAALRTTTGQQTFEIAGLNGNTPKAAMFQVTAATTDATAVDGIAYGIGFCDNTRQYTATFYSVYNVATTESFRRGRSDKCIMMYDTSGNVDFEAEFVSFSGNSVRINVTNAPSSAYLITVTLFAGDDITPEVRTVLPGTVNTKIEYNTFGREYHAFIMMSLAFSEFDNTESTNAALTMGLVSWDGVMVQQRAFGWRSRNSVNPSETFAAIGEYGWMSGRVNSFAQVEWKAQVFEVDNDGFTLVTRESTETDESIVVLALDVGYDNVYIGTFKEPTATGNDNLTSLPFQPGFGFQLLTSVQVPETVLTGSGSGFFGNGLFDSDTAYANNVAEEDNTTPTNNQSYTDDAAIYIADGNGTAQLIGALSAFNSDGWTINYSTNTESVEKLSPILAIKSQAAAASDPGAAGSGETPTPDPQVTPNTGPGTRIYSSGLLDLKRVP